MEYAIVDIETTGGSPSNSKIIEIAIVITDGKQILDSYETLISPEARIPYKITALTGIDDRMVRNSPKFYEVAKTILEYLQGRIFVAHNVNFDYGFIKNEYKQLGFDFDSKKLCTVRLSRKTFPNLPSYSLGKLCNSLGVKLNNAHRAMADTIATTEIFHLIMSNEEEIKKVNVLAEKLRVSKLPNKPGVYYFLNKENEIIYIGKSISIKKRVQTHLNNYQTSKGMAIIENIHSIKFELTGNETMALLYETKAIKQHRPIYNHAQKKTKFPFGISIDKDSGFHKLEVVPVNQHSDTVIEFGSRREAISFMRDTVDEFKLCLKINGQENVNRVGSCFNYQLHNCHGACVEEESIEDYNLRIEQFEKKFRNPTDSGVYLANGRKTTEQSFIILENGIIAGFGFVTKKSAINLGSLQLMSEVFESDKDYQRVLKVMHKNRSFEKVKL